MKIIKILLLLAMFSACSGYRQITITKQIFKKEKTGKNDIDNELKYYKLFNKDSKSYPDSKNRISRIKYKKYFAVINSNPALSKINDKAIEYALEGNYIKAKILFNELLKEGNNIPQALNNAGLVDELLNDKESAFDMYIKACMLEPDNEYFRQNLLYLSDNFL